MTKMQRRSIRNALIEAGMHHADIGHDESGDGSYTEVWATKDGANVVTVAWGPRDLDTK